MAIERDNSIGAQTRTSVEIAIVQQGESDLPSRAIATTLGGLGYQITKVSESSSIVICFKIDDVITYLTKGKSVLHLTGAGRSSEVCASALRDPEWSTRYRHVKWRVPNLVEMLSALHHLVSQVQGNFPRAVPGVLDLGLPEELKKSQLRDKRILILDDTEANRNSAAWQFGDTNVVEVFSSYRTAVEALRQNRYDLVLLDLLMQPESFMLSDTAYAKVAGSEFSAGSIVALVASLSPATQVTVVTDASHHDHPATALLDYLWNQPITFANGSSLTFRQAATVGMPDSPLTIKDWDRSICLKSE